MAITKREVNLLGSYVRDNGPSHDPDCHIVTSEKDLCTCGRLAAVRHVLYELGRALSGGGPDFEVCIMKPGVSSAKLTIPEDKPLEVGDVVKLRSGGPRLMIKRIHPAKEISDREMGSREATVIWIGEDSEWREARVPIECLVRPYSGV